MTKSVTRVFYLSPIYVQMNAHDTMMCKWRCEKIWAVLGNFLVILQGESTGKKQSCFKEIYP